MTAYARGTHAIGLCQRCGFVHKLSQLREDGQTPGLLVCDTCWDMEQEAEAPIDVTDATALYHPAPDLDATASRTLEDDTPLAELLWPDKTTEPYFGGET
jgi:hypothetical protein